MPKEEIPHGKTWFALWSEWLRCGPGSSCFALVWWELLLLLNCGTMCFFFMTFCEAHVGCRIILDMFLTRFDNTCWLYIKIQVHLYLHHLYWIIGMVHLNELLVWSILLNYWYDPSYWIIGRGPSYWIIGIRNLISQLCGTNRSRRINDTILRKLYLHIFGPRAPYYILGAISWNRITI